MVWGSFRFINRELSKCILLKLVDITVQYIFFSEKGMVMSNAGSEVISRENLILCRSYRVVQLDHGPRRHGADGVPYEGLFLEIPPGPTDQLLCVHTGAIRVVL